MPRLSRFEAALRGSIGAHRLHAKYDSRAITKAARDAFMARWEDEVDPNHTLTPAERARRARHALKAHMMELALRSARLRRRRSASKTKKAATVAGNNLAALEEGEDDSHPSA
jgi:hypothetical protein